MVCTTRTRAYRPYRLNGTLAPSAIVTGVKSASAVAPSVPYSTVTTVVPPATASQPSACVTPEVSTNGPRTGEFTSRVGVTVSQIVSPLRRGIRNPCCQTRPSVRASPGPSPSARAQAPRPCPSARTATYARSRLSPQPQPRPGPGPPADGRPGTPAPSAPSARRHPASRRRSCPARPTFPSLTRPLRVRLEVGEQLVVQCPWPSTGGVVVNSAEAPATAPWLLSRRLPSITV